MFDGGIFAGYRHNQVLGGWPRSRPLRLDDGGVPRLVR